MKIIIVGDGKVGHTLSQQLVQEGHDITVIDNNSEILDTTMESLDIIGINGNGASVEVLKEAGVSTADLLIAATSADELNMLCCLTAKHLGVGKTIARVRNPEYRSQLQMLQNEFGLSMVINPELEAAREISRVIKFPPAAHIDTFSRGQVELLEYRIPEHSLLAGMKLLELPSLSGTRVLICAVERAGAVHIPNGGFVLRAGDRIHLTGQGKEISRFLGHVDDVKFKIRTILIVGGGRIAYYLCNMLEEKYFHIKIVEKNRGRAEELCELFPKITVIHGDGADIELLESEGLADADAFIALTNMDEENLVTSIMADQHNVPKIITKIGRFNYLPVMENMGIDTVVNPKMTTSNKIVQYVRTIQNSEGMSNIMTLHKLVGGKVEAVEFEAKNCPYAGVKLADLPLRPGLLIAVLVRKNKAIIPGGQDEILPGDSVIVVTNQPGLSRLDDIFGEN